ncbi:MBL fold metallo-hydrolase [Sphingopyxis indica]|uniref:L-ascorbate metabolism protein UlaG, beta-lactamase superfamily n=1 Tax=Sphingopyxis indica TaxID=436663 RepID=A0A239LA21_9SPHN|nr:MBL fold metallo-hydrolase [Sphingopyxis indica]SNT27497.1 L-ascorbate metabolism protein UlaG, beta-lactamase superfamily [Sphingopyxis indica]
MAVAVSSCTDKNLYYNPDKAHHTPTGFQNINGKLENSFSRVAQWKWQALFKEIRNADAYDFPLLAPDQKKIRDPQAGIQATWIGQATLLVQMEGLNILTDPHFTERASPFSWMGPKRTVRPALSVEQLPKIDLVLISHDHYDHLDRETIHLLLEKQPQIQYYAPLGIGRWLIQEGVSAKNVAELDWWDEAAFQNMKVVATPLQHWGRRSPLDTNVRLWSGWIVAGESHRFVFIGDTGYDKSHFAEIGRRYGPFDLAAIPIGAYEPRWFMKDQHVNPEEAVLIHGDIQSKLSIGIHWGTFVLTDEDLTQPPKDLAAALDEKKIPHDAFQILTHGGMLEIP